ncbi:amidase [Paenibacillus alkaliterrae]|uniref:amidase n=1 Tax=Paenibacillus alkaliterrae TaxID=320909 RepID=UPI001F1EA431|nr:amidase [Paenibacillus alkaliterrae]MCF2938163.1 amidase [Paenibacillus alkaliterrae]
MEQRGKAYMNEHIVLEPTGKGRLSGKTFAVKDVFDIAGHTSSAGNPDWLRTHRPANGHAAVIGRLLGSGARLEGTTITDEMMYSVNGENAHYGTPVNPKAPGRIPGGSSSGSASVVAAGLADFAIGTDTGGSVRVPAAYCGIYGIRPTHGAVDSDGLIPLAPSFDTVGWMARDAQTMLEVGRVLLESPAACSGGAFQRVLFAEDLWALPDEHSMQALQGYVPMLRSLAESHEQTVLAPEGLQAWMNAFRRMQAIEIWRGHGGWVTREQPSFGPGIAERFAWAATLKPEEHGDAFAKREEVRTLLEQLLGKNTVLVAPTVPAIAPLLGLSGEEAERRRAHTLQMSCAAGLAGFPQMTVPVPGELGCPIGLSFIAGPHQDLRLLEWVADLADERIRRISLGGSV